MRGNNRSCLPGSGKISYDRKQEKKLGCEQALFSNLLHVLVISKYIRMSGYGTNVDYRVCKHGTAVSSSRKEQQEIVRSSFSDDTMTRAGGVRGRRTDRRARSQFSLHSIHVSLSERNKGWDDKERELLMQDV